MSTNQFPLAPPPSSFRQSQVFQKTPENQGFSSLQGLERSRTVPRHPHISVGMDVGLEKWQG